MDLSRQGLIVKHYYPEGSEPNKVKRALVPIYSILNEPREEGNKVVFVYSNQVLELPKERYMSVLDMIKADVRERTAARGVKVLEETEAIVGKLGKTIQINLKGLPAVG